MFAKQREVDEWSKHLWHMSQHSRTPIFLAGRLQKQAQEMRKAVGLKPFGWNYFVPDAMFKECSVHSENCEGQETHPS